MARAPAQPRQARVPIDPLAPAERRELRRALAAPGKFGTRGGDLLSRFLLVEVVNSALRSLSLDELLGRLVALAVATLDAERGTIFVYDAEHDQLFSRVALGSEVAEIRISRMSGIAGAVFGSGRAEIIDQPYGDARFDASVDEATGYRTRSILAVPLHDPRGGVIGVVEILNKRKDGFDAVDVGLLQVISEQAATALAHARAFAEERNERQLNQKLLELTETIALELDLDRLLEKVTDAAAALLDGERATIFLLDAAAGELVARVTAGGAVGDIRFAATLGIAGVCLATGRAVTVSDAYADPRFNTAIDARTGFRTRTLVCVPLVDQNGRPSGVLEVLNKRTGPFTAGDERRLRSFAAQAATAVQNAQLFADVLSLKSYTDGILRTLSDGVVTLDQRLDIATINEAARRILRLPDGVEPKGSAAQLWGKANPWLVEALDYVTATGGTDDRPDVEFALGDGAAASVNATIAPVRSGGGGFTGVTIVLQDVSRQKKVQSVVTRYMARQFSEQVLTGDGARDATTTEVATVLFSDIRRFTSIAETLTPQATVDMLNEYFAEMTAIVLRHGGALDKYIGDAVMAVFGAPLAVASDTDNALATANDMIRSLRALNRRREGRGARPLEIGVGLATGEVAAGPLGGAARADYTVIGDSVNLASRLEGATKHYGATVLLAGSTVERLVAPARLRRIDLIRVKGKEQPTEIFEALDHHTAETLPGLDRMVPCYEDGIGLYRKRDWTGAIAKFSQALAICPKDGPSWIYADRCLYYRDHPPDDHWDGVWRMTSK
jgi:adenylate cyclase